MFVKIFLSFWLTVGLFAAAQEIAARLAHNEEQRTIASVRRMVNEGHAIVAAYEGRGAHGAAEAVDAFERRQGLFVDLLDARRTSVIGRSVQPVEIELARQADRLAAAGWSDAALSMPEGLAAQRVVTSAGQRMTIVVGLPRPIATVIARALLLWSPVRFMVILSIGGLVCLVVARHLTRPIVDLSEATRALAEGRLHTRVGEGATKRRDEIGTLARDFDRMAEQIESLVAGQRRLLGDVSHELRSPLARLAVALSLARKGPSADQPEYFGRIERETKRLDRLIEQLLTLARIESGVDRQLRGAFALAELVQGVVGDGDFEARARDARVTLLACEAVTMTGFAELMRSAIENVVRNAIRHTRPGSSVDVALRLIGDRSAEISIRDRGPGIDERVTADIFKPFWRAPTSEDRLPDGAGDRQPDGAGLGLAITDRIVRMHEGRISAANAPGGGLIVTIQLPFDKHRERGLT